MFLRRPSSGQGHTRILVVLVLLYATTFGLVLPWVCKTWIYSSYYVPDQSVEDTVRRALHINDQRLSLAVTYLEQQQQRMRTHDEAPPGVDVAIGVITVGRENAELWRLGYLTQVIAQLMTLASRDFHFGNKAIFICNTDYVPLEHMEAVRMSKYVPMVTRFNNVTSGGVIRAADTAEIFDKERADYVFCLKESLKFKPNYVILLEDDALPTDLFFQTLHHLLHDRINKKKVGRETPAYRDNRDWMFLKLFYPDKWGGYSYTGRHIAELVGFGCVGWTLFSLLADVCIRTRPRWSCKLMISVCGAAYAVLLVHVIGRPYVMKLWSFSAYTHHVVAAPGCCTPAVLYSAMMAEVTSDYLSSIVCHIDFSKDVALDWLANNNGYRRYLVEPNLVKHIGLWSSLRTYAKLAAEFA